MKIDQFLKIPKILNIDIVKSNLKKSINANHLVITDKAQESGDHVILFYLLKSESDVPLFLERIKNHTYALIITTFNFPLKQFKNNLWVITPNDFFQLLEYSLQRAYPIHPELKLVAITGTNGKTTTVHLLREIGHLAQVNVCSFGTLGFFKGQNLVEDTSLTTPSLVTFYRLLHQHMNNSGYVFFEFSSHALYLKRLGNIELDCAGWTNFTQDHLDFHENMEEYFFAKAIILKHLKKTGKLFIAPSGQVVSQKLKNYKNIKLILKSSFQNIVSFFPDYLAKHHNLENMQLALTIIDELGIKYELESLRKITMPLGRFDVKTYGESIYVIDYAHTSDALERLLIQAKSTYLLHKIIVVFGCGGDRDRTKRPLMGKVASELADYVILTSDNPRTENPELIIEEIAQGCLEKSKVSIEVDRTKAIKLAREKFASGVVVIAGKGHEPYMDIMGKKIPYSDYQVIEQLHTPQNQALNKN